MKSRRVVVRHICQRLTRERIRKAGCSLVNDHAFRVRDNELSYLIEERLV